MCEGAYSARKIVEFCCSLCGRANELRLFSHFGKSDLPGVQSTNRLDVIGALSRCDIDWNGSSPLNFPQRSRQASRNWQRCGRIFGTFAKNATQKANKFDLFLSSKSRHPCCSTPLHRNRSAFGARQERRRAMGITKCFQQKTHGDCLLYFY